MGPSSHLKVDPVFVKTGSDFENDASPMVNNPACHFYQQPPQTLDGLSRSVPGHHQKPLANEEIISHDSNAKVNSIGQKLSASDTQSKSPPPSLP